MIFIYNKFLSINSSKLTNLFLNNDSKFNLGKEIFLNKGKCANCHTLSNAGSYADIGPDLNKVMPKKIRVIKTVTEGIGSMPAMADILSKDEIEAVAEYVYQASKK